MLEQELQRPDDKDEVWPRYAKALAAFEAFRKTCYGERSLDKHRNALKKIKEETNKEITTAFVQRFVNKVGPEFGTSRPDPSAKMEFRNIVRIVKIIAPGQDPLEFVDPQGQLAAEIRQAKSGKHAIASSASHWVKSKDEHWNEKFAKIVVHPFVRTDKDSLVPVVVSIGIENISHEIIETENKDSVEISVGIRRQIEIQPKDFGVELLADLRGATKDGNNSGIRYSTVWTIPIRDGHNGWPLVEERICDLRPYGKGPHSLALMMSCSRNDLKVSSVTRLDGRSNSRKSDYNSKQRYFIERFVKERSAPLGEDGLTIKLATIIFAPETSS